jgi:hypothetical protein
MTVLVVLAQQVAAVAAAVADLALALQLVVAQAVQE